MASKEWQSVLQEENSLSEQLAGLAAVLKHTPVWNHTARQELRYVAERMPEILAQWEQVHQRRLNHMARQRALTSLRWHNQFQYVTNHPVHQ